MDVFNQLMADTFSICPKEKLNTTSRLKGREFIINTYTKDYQEATYSTHIRHSSNLIFSLPIPVETRIPITLLNVMDAISAQNDRYYQKIFIPRGMTIALCQSY